MIKLGVNIDHIATLRQARNEQFPDPIQAALEAIRGGADGITAHLREDRRHIQDRDIAKLKKSLLVPLNMEMSLSPEIVQIALRVKPNWVCLVPEKRLELTTEGGLDVKKSRSRLTGVIQKLHEKNINVSLFIDPNLSVIHMAKDVQADAVELHTGRYARLWPKSSVRSELKKIKKCATEARQMHLIVNAGHGINYENVKDLSSAFDFDEYNIGFAIVARSVSVGLQRAVQEMKKRMKV